MSVVYAPRWYQSEAVQSVFDYFVSGKTGNPVIAMPTGTGKSIVLALLIKQIFDWYPTQRVMMLTHVAKLIEQNAEKLESVWPTVPLGIYSAELGRRDMIAPIVFAGVQSVAPAIKKALGFEDGLHPNQKHFGWRDIVFVDEAHMVSPEEDTQYQYVLAELKKINPYIKVVGLTATAYRQRQGMITDGGIFTDICYDITGVEAFNRLVAEGHMSLLIPKRTKVEVDTSQVKITAGEFNEKQLEKEIERITHAAVREMCEMAYDRSTWLVFTAGIDNAMLTAELLNSYGVAAAAVHSKQPAKLNKSIMDAYQVGELQAVVNMGKLTTGYDNPRINFIGMLRATRSVPLWVQMLGRGTRPHEPSQKNNCLVADFGANSRRLGPINDPVIPRKPGKGGGDMPVRICESCDGYNHAAARECVFCGAEFEFKPKITATAQTDDIMRADADVIEYINVTKVLYHRHEKRDKLTGELISPPCMKVSYYCGLKCYTDWVFFEHSGVMARKAKDWWQLRSSEPVPITTHDAIQKISNSRPPSRIRVLMNRKYPEVLSAEW